MRKLFEKAALLFPIFLYKFLNSLLDFFRFFLFWRKKISKDAKKILIFRVGNIGDTICAIPSMAAIRKNFPAAKIVLLSSPGKEEMPGAKELLSGVESLDDLIIYYQEDIKNPKGKTNLIKRLKKEKFDLFIEFSQSLTNFSIEMRNIIFAKLIGAKYACGFRINAIWLFKRIQSKYLKFDNEVKRLLKKLKKEGLKIGEVSFPLPISEGDKKVVNIFLREFNNKKFIAINPNAKRQTNLWSLDKFAEVGKCLLSNYNVNVLIIGGKKDKERTDKLKGMIGEGAINAVGRFSLLQTIELLKHCEFLISNDTGAVHMAAAVKTAVIGIYSARDFKNKWSPYGENNIVLRKEPKCHTCFKEECEQLTCLKEITVDEVLKAVENIHQNVKGEFLKKEG